MERITKEFINYLFEIGLVSVTSVKEFVTAINQAEGNKEIHINNEFGVRELLSKAIVKYLDELSPEGKKLLSLNVIAKFTENKSLERIKSAKALYTIYSRKFLIQRLIKKKEKFVKWRRAVDLGGMYSNSNVNVSGMGSVNSESKSMHFETSICKKEREELRNCTFKPEINKNFSRPQSEYNMPAYQRLYTDYERLQNKKDIKKIEMDNKESNMLSFSPDLTVTGNKTTYKNDNDFFSRQDKFRKSKEKHQEQVIKELEEEMEREFTFVPKVLKSSSSKKMDNSMSTATVNSPKQMLNSSSHQSYSNLPSNTPIHQKLYQDKFRRERNKQITNRKLNEDKLSLSMDRTTERSKSGYKRKNSVDFGKIQQLYNDHKKNNLKKKELLKSIEKEQGITFKPEVNSNEKYTPNMKFNDRNKKLLEDKKNFVEIYNHIYEENLSNQKWGAGKKYSPDEVESINKGIHERLYSKGREKQLQRNSIDDIHDRERFDFKSYLRSTDNKQTANFAQSGSYNSNSHCKDNSVSERFPQQSPKSLTNKNLTFGMNNQNLLLNSKDKDFLPKKEKNDTYTFAKNNKRIIDKNYNYVFDEAVQNEEEREGEEAMDYSASREERVRPADSISSTSKKMKPKIGGKSKNIIVDTADHDFYVRKSHNADEEDYQYQDI